MQIFFIILENLYKKFFKSTYAKIFYVLNILFLILFKFLNIINKHLQTYYGRKIFIMDDNTSAQNNGLRRLTTLQLLNFCLGFSDYNLPGR